MNSRREAGRSWRAVARVLRSPRRLATTLAHDLTSLFFPSDCSCCEGPLVGAGRVPVCAACFARVTPDLLLPGCSRCGDALNLDLDLEDARFAGLLAEGLLCRVCRMAPPAFTRAIAYGTYRGELRTLLRMLKFQRVPAVAGLVSERLAQTMAQLEPLAAADCLVIAVPLFRRRERQRGFNQSILLADRALVKLRKMHPQWRLQAAHGLLERSRSTHTQFALGRRDRRRNLRGAFRVGGDVRGREVLLIDDILTTGATARECARVLVEAGASRVWVVTLARAQSEFLRRQHEDPAQYVAAWDLPSTATGQAGS